MLRTLDSTQLHCSCLTVFAKCQRLHTCNRGDAVSRFIHFFTFRSGSFTLAPIRLMPSLLPHSPCLSLSVLLPPCLALAPFPSRSRSRSLSLSLSFSLFLSLSPFRTETGVMAWCWAVFAGSVGFQLSNILLLVHRRKVPLLRRVIHTGMGVHLVASGWLAWDGTPRDDYKSSMAVNVVAVVVSIVYNCRVLQPFAFESARVSCQS